MSDLELEEGLSSNVMLVTIRSLINENKQLNTQVTELQALGSKLVEENRELKMNQRLRIGPFDFEAAYYRARADYKETIRLIFDRMGDFNAGKFTNLIAQRLGKQRSMNKALRLDIEEQKAENARVRDELVDALNEIDKLNDSDDDTVCADHE